MFNVPLFYLPQHIFRLLNIFTMFVNFVIVCIFDTLSFWPLPLPYGTAPGHCPGHCPWPVSLVAAPCTAQPMFGVTCLAPSLPSVMSVVPACLGSRAGHRLTARCKSERGRSLGALRKGFGWEAPSLCLTVSLLVCLFQGGSPAPATDASKI